MQDHTSYETASEAINDLVKRGYTLDFNLHEEEDCLICKETTAQLSPGEFEIDEIYRFEGNTDPGDEMIVFAISSRLDDAKGILVNAYGMYSDSNASIIVEKLKQHLS
ncbi:MAG: phosphoribosylpyrophosphate synthetase [Saprospiraceae bacterium]|nr:phosphoribosylpyrophosphate synthetase [Saprospiraceae bacterium]